MVNVLPPAARVVPDKTESQENSAVRAAQDVGPVVDYLSGLFRAAPGQTDFSYSRDPAAARSARSEKGDRRV